MKLAGITFDRTKVAGLGEIATPSYSPVWAGVSIASGALSAYHGVKRNNGSVGWGIVWFFMGSIFPIVTPAIAVAQGFAKPIRGGR